MTNSSGVDAFLERRAAIDNMLACSDVRDVVASLLWKAIAVMTKRSLVAMQSTIRDAMGFPLYEFRSKRREPIVAWNYWGEGSCEPSCNCVCILRVRGDSSDVIADDDIAVDKVRRCLSQWLLLIEQLRINN